MAIIMRTLYLLVYMCVFYMFSHRKKKLLSPALSKQFHLFPMHHILKTAQCAEQLPHSEKFSRR